MRKRIALVLRGAVVRGAAAVRHHVECGRPQFCIRTGQSDDRRTATLSTGTTRSGFHSVHHNRTPALFGNSAGSAPWDYSFVFNSIGDSTFHYICEVHPSTMQGTVTVQPAASIEVTAPNGGESWYAGSLQTITWNSAERERGRDD